MLPVKGGLTRFLAVFSSDPPPVTGPVRSAREADLELLGQFGRPVLAYSGATQKLLPVVAKAPSPGRLTSIAGWSRWTGRWRPVPKTARCRPPR